jgi:RND family efflux transporter MFP subunit
VLTSPVSGVVTARNYDPGDMSGTQPVLTIGQITPSVKVVIGINEAERSKITAGMPVSVEFDAFPDEKFDAKISRVYPSVDPQTRTFQAEVIIPNNGEKFFPGMFARCTVSLGIENHVVVPDRAVVKQTGSGNKYVYVYKNGKVSYNRVEIGRRVDTAYEVISGVNDGDTVVIAGQSRLADGVPVQLKKTQSKTK